LSRSVILCSILLAVLTLAAAPAVAQTTINIDPASKGGPSNCHPFGGYGYGIAANSYGGFVYKNVPAFDMSAGDTVAFDLSAQNDVNIQVDVALAAATTNGGWQQTAAGFTTVVSNKVAADPNGNTTKGDYELAFTADAPFSFAGGGLIVRIFPRGGYAADSSCSQVLTMTNSGDSSGYFVGRYYNDGDGGHPWSGTDTSSLGGMRLIVTSIDAEAGGPYSGAEGSPIVFDGSGSSSSSSITNYEWDCTNDGSYDVSSSSPTGSSCTYPDDGSYTTKLRLTDSNANTDTDTAAVTVSNVAPSVSLSGPTTGDEGQSLSFTGSFTDPGSADTHSVAWDFGDSATATGSLSQSHTFVDDGTYTVTVTVTDDDGGADSASLTVNVGNVAPTITSVSAPDGAEGVAIAMSAAATDPGPDALTYSWNFGDSSTGTGTSVSHTYADDGSYTVTLTVTDGDGGSDVQTETVVVANLNPIITSVSAPDGTEGVAIAMSATATDVPADPLSFSWNFGDSTSGSGASVSHAYADQGTYTVTLTVTDGDGGSATATETVVVGNAAPVITSTTIPSNGVEGSPLSLSAAGTDVAADPLTWSWNFGDSTSGSGSSVSHTWVEDGTYTVTVTLSDGDGGTDTATGTVTIANAAPVISATTFGSGDEGDVIPFSVAFTDAGLLDTHTIAWDFGDSSSGAGSSPTHVYADDGSYTVTVTVTDDEGATDTATGTAVIGNAAPAITSSSMPDGDEGETLTFTVAFTDSGSADTHTVAWDFGDAGSGAGASTTHSYDDDGSYTVTATVTDDDGATDTVTGTVTIANVDPVIASVTGPTAGSEGELLSWTVAATDASPVDVLTYSFDYGDGSPAVVGSDVDGEHTYADNGVYTLTVTVTDDDGGSDVETLTITIGNEPPTIDAISVPTTAPEGSTVTMTATASDVGSDTLTFDWDFGDAATATGEAVTHAWADDGTYTITLTVTDDDGDADVQTVVITITNVDPTIDSMVVPDGDEGEDLVFSATASDVGADTLTFSWDFGDGAPVAIGETVNHTYADDGVYTVTLTVTDDDGGGDGATDTATIGNVAPTVDNLTGPGTGDEGSSLLYTATGSDPGADVLSWTWDFGDGTPVLTTAASQDHTFADDGIYGVTVTITDDDGATASSTLVVAVANVDPTITGMLVPDGDEGSTLSFDSAATDPGDDTLVHTWDFGDGSADEVGLAPTHVYDDDGAYTVTLTVTEEDGGIAVETGTATVGNVAPELTSMTGPATGDEGSDLTFAASGDDVGPADLPDLTFTWDFGDGTPTETGETIDHAFSDEGTYTVTVVLDDGDGATDVDTLVIDIFNVAPEITSSAPAYASEAVLWSYQAVAVDPGDDVLTWTLGSGAPDGMTLDPATGLMEWTPSYDQSLGGPYSATITVEDGDGGLDSQTFTVTVGWTDEDGDGMADEWELDNGLDPTDPTDANEDPDGDGVDNLTEFLDGTDPNAFDGPTAPVLLEPIEDAEVVSSTPDLLIENATDPQLDVLTYDFEVYEDEAMTIFVTSAGGGVPETADETTWKVDVPLDENGQYWWRAAAFDGAAWGPWTDVESFLVNEFNEAPPVPVPLFPVDGETVALVDVELSWSCGDDIDGDMLTFDVVLWDDAMETILTEVFDVEPDEARDVTAAWLVDIGLDEDAYYHWQVRAVDEHLVEGDWSEAELFFFNTSNAAPEGVYFLDPLDGDVVGTVSPELLASEAIDPEGGELSYVFEVDTAPTFDSADLVGVELPETLTGAVLWDLAADGVELPEDVTVHARVRALDEEGVGSEWDVISFFVAGDNTAPETPVLLLPEDGAETDDVVPVFVVGNVLDPEGDLVFFDFVIARDLEMTDVVAAATDILTGSGPLGDEDQTSWRPDLNLDGELYWSARAVDELGAPSAWAEPFMLTVHGGEPPIGDDDDDVTTGGGGQGCDCESSVAGRGAGAMPLALLLGLAGLGILRRRR
jgi:PKD repeat protein